MKISFIGYGNMAKAIARGLIQQQAHSLYAAAPSLSVGVNEDQVCTHNDNKEVIKDADIIILAVKPFQMSQMLKEISGIENGPCLSLYQPTHRRHPENQEDPIRFRNLVKDLEASLLQKYPAAEAKLLLEPFHALDDGPQAVGRDAADLGVVVRLRCL